MSAAIETTRRELETLETIQFVSSALFDVSAEKIIRLRAAFEKNQSFYDEVSQLYDSLKYTAVRRGDLPALVPGTGRVLYVAFTSNVRFYGSSNTDVMRTFVQKFGPVAADGLVIGRTGRAFMENNGIEASRVTYRSFESDEPTAEEVQNLLLQAQDYDEVQVIYPSFVTVFTQEVAMLDITHTAQEQDLAREKDITDYIFEPEFPKIIDFFETRVRQLLFQRVVLESELARTAARLFAMNGAQDRAEKEIGHVQQSMRRAINNFNDARLLESFAAISKWKI